jgi:ubiquinone/menaquinone biosynthesis C-methylase UbiE
MSTNIGYWEEVLKAPTPAYQELFDAEIKYLLDNIKSGAKTLDIGCGEGRNIKTILNRSKDVTGIDNDPIAVKDASDNFSGIPSVRIVCAEAVNLPFEDESFDVVTFLMILPNLDKQKEKGLREAARVLKSDGLLILSTFSEEAFDERMKVYKKVGAPIELVEGTKVIFDKSVGANISEQFSFEEINNLAKSAGLKIIKHSKIGKLAYICTLVKS